MPCMCWYDPPDEKRKEFKMYCSHLVELIKLLNKDGDALGCTIQDAHKLIDHLYNPPSCKEKPR